MESQLWNDKANYLNHAYHECRDVNRLWNDELHKTIVEDRPPILSKPVDNDENAASHILDSVKIEVEIFCSCLLLLNHFLHCMENGSQNDEASIGFENVSLEELRNESWNLSELLLVVLLVGRVEVKVESDDEGSSNCHSQVLSSEEFLFLNVEIDQDKNEEDRHESERNDFVEVVHERRVVLHFDEAKSNNDGSEENNDSLYIDLLSEFSCVP